MKTYESWSAVRPEEWDKTSSKNKIYHNTDVIQEEEEGITIYRYTVTEYTNKEYAVRSRIPGEQTDDQDETEQLAEAARILLGEAE